LNLSHLTYYVVKYTSCLWRAPFIMWQWSAIQIFTLNQVKYLLWLLHAPYTMATLCSMQYRSDVPLKTSAIIYKHAATYVYNKIYLRQRNSNISSQSCHIACCGHIHKTLHQTKYPNANKGNLQQNTKQEKRQQTKLGEI